MKNGDVAGIAAFAYKYGYVGVKMENGTKKIVMVNTSSDSVPQEIQSINLTSDKVYLKVDFDFNGGNKANFYYSIDGANWNKIGNSLNMEYLLKHFMGYRFGLFNYATQTIGGYVDFDYFRVSDELKGAGKEEISDEESTLPTPNTNYATIDDGWYYIKNIGSQKYLQVADNEAGNAVNVEIGTGTGELGQKWYLKNVGDGYFTLKNGTGYALDIVYGKDENKINVQTYTANGLNSQQFKLLPTTEYNSYGIVTRCSTDNKGLDVEDKATMDGANVQQYFYYGATNQIWSFEPINNSQGSGSTTDQEQSSGQETEQTSQEKNIVRVKVTSDWTSGAVADITITNTTGIDLNGWTCTFTTNRPITSIWNAELVSKNGNIYTIKNPSWQTNLAAGASYTFGGQLGSGSSNVTVTDASIK